MVSSKLLAEVDWGTVNYRYRMQLRRVTSSIHQYCTTGGGNNTFTHKSDIHLRNMRRYAIIQFAENKLRYVVNPTISSSHRKFYPKNWNTEKRTRYPNSRIRTSLRKLGIPIISICICEHIHHRRYHKYHTRLIIMICIATPPINNTIKLHPIQYSSPVKRQYGM